MPKRSVKRLESTKLIIGRGYSSNPDHTDEMYVRFKQATRYALGRIAGPLVIQADLTVASPEFCSGGRRGGARTCGSEVRADKVIQIPEVKAVWR